MASKGTKILIFLWKNYYLLILGAIFCSWLFIGRILQFLWSYPYFFAAIVTADILVLYITWRWFAVNVRGGTSEWTSGASLKGKTVVITGGNSGLGRETAVDLALRGARIIIGCRNPTKAEAAVEEIRRRSGNKNVVYRKLNLSSFKSVREFAEKINDEEDRLDILLNNAGVPNQAVYTKDLRKPLPSVDGYTESFQVNHFSHFLLTHLLLDLLTKRTPSRIINVSSRLHKWAKPLDFTLGSPSDKMRYPRLTGYNQGKLANVLFTKELAKRLAGTGIEAFSVDPGAIYTSIWGKEFGPITLKIMSPLLWLFFTNERVGAQTSIYCAVESGLTSGATYFNCGIAKYKAPLADNIQMAEKLWDVSVEVTNF